MSDKATSFLQKGMELADAREPNYALLACYLTAAVIEALILIARAVKSPRD